MYIFKKILKNAFNSGAKISSSFKLLFPKFIGLVSIKFLRKTNTFIKSKYSKNRQWSKSIVYFGLWFGVVSAFTFTYFNYRFIFLLSYLWWVCAIVVFIAMFNNFKKYNQANSLKFFNFFL